jgi:hypothetical protein
MEQSLWIKVAAAGQRAMDLMRRAPEFQRGTVAARMAAEASSANIEMTKALCAYIEELEARLSAVPLAYRGIWRAGQTFPARSFVTFGGSVWYTASETDRRPGEGVDWVLACKKGADAKERT